MESATVLVSGKPVLIDVEDLPHFSAHKWRLSTGGYVRRHRGENSDSYLHRDLLKAPVFAFVDHINGDPRDNRKANLRFCHHRQNMRNTRATEGTSKYKGVGKHFTRWRARIRQGDRRYDIGRFDTELEAAQAYNHVARILFGAFARLNDVVRPDQPLKGMRFFDDHWIGLAAAEQVENAA
jgi:hypothetical protein